MRTSGCVVAVVHAVAVATASAAAPPWSEGGTVETTSYQTAEGASLDVVFMRSPTREAARTVARRFEAGAHDKAVEQGKDVSYAVREDGDALVADHVADVSGQIIQMRRLVGATEAHLVAVSARCMGPVRACTRELQSLRFDRSGFQRFDVTADDVLVSAYRAGQGIGRLLAAAIVGLLVVGWLLRVRRRRAI